jgi:hypothetical protein
VFQTIIIFSSEARPVAYLNVTIVSSVGSAWSVPVCDHFPSERRLSNNI